MNKRKFWGIDRKIIGTKKMNPEKVLDTKSVHKVKALPLYHQ